MLHSKFNRLISNTADNITYGSFILINTLHMKNDISIDANPTQNISTLLSFGITGAFVWSKMTNPRPPRVNRKLEANPSIMYWPLTLYGIKATWRKGNFTHKFHWYAVSNTSFFHILIKKWLSTWMCPFSRKKDSSVRDKHVSLTQRKKGVHF